MIRYAMVAQHCVTCVGVVSGITYVLQSWTQIKRHGFRHWLEAGFEKIEKDL